MSTSWATTSYTPHSSAHTGCGSLLVQDSLYIKASKIDFELGTKLGIMAIYSSSFFYISGFSYYEPIQWRKKVLLVKNTTAAQNLYIEGNY